VVYELAQIGLSVAEVARQAGLQSQSLKPVLHRRWPRGQQLIAAALGRAPEQIWPSRYQKQAARTTGKRSVAVCTDGSKPTWTNATEAPTNRSDLER